MKRYVLPTIKVLIALVVAVALTRIAFFPSDGDESADGPTPSYDDYEIGRASCRERV